MQMENKEICKACGGICCKKCGCDYLPKDFENLSFKYLYEKLEEGEISIVSILKFSKLKDSRKVITPFLYLRARNINRNIVDLLSLKTTCKELNENGCLYSIEKRPSGGVNLIPKENMNCFHLEDPLEMMKKWEPYQKVLSRLVKRITGLSVDEQLKLDIENLFTDILNENFDYVSEKELLEVKPLLLHLIEIYPELYLNATKKYQNNKYLKVKK